MKVAQKGSMEQVNPVINNGELLSVKLDEIDTSFENTRNKLDSKVVSDLAESIRHNGLINPITLNKQEDGTYTIIAGFSRFQALKSLNQSEVMARVFFNLNNAAALEVGSAENLVRKNLSISDQLILIKRLITELGSDDTATLAARLSWSKTHIKSLLKVARAPKEVLMALDEGGKVTLGHAAWLAQLVDVGGGDLKSNTALILKTLEKIKIEGWSVAELKKRVLTKHIPLNIAKFDKKACQGCEFNSDTFGNLFGEETDSAMCSKPSCFKAKSDELLSSARLIAEEKFGNVITITNISKNALTPITPEYLGDEQVKSCATCDDNITVLNDIITSKAYTVAKPNLCRNKECYNICATRFIEQKEKDSVDEIPVNATAENLNVTTENAKPKEKLTSQQITPSNSQTKCSQSAMAELMFNKLSDPDVKQILVCYALQHLTGTSNISDAIQQNPDLVDGSFKDALTKSYEILVKYLSKHEKDESKPVDILLDLFRNNKNESDLLDQSWNASHLKNYTIAGIIAICEESGFVKYYGQDKFNKLSKGSKGDLLKAIEKENWDGWDSYHHQCHAKSNNKNRNKIFDDI